SSAPAARAATSAVRGRPGAEEVLEAEEEAGVDTPSAYRPAHHPRPARTRCVRARCVCARRVSDPAHDRDDLAEDGRLVTVDGLVGVVAWHQPDVPVRF